MNSWATTLLCAASLGALICFVIPPLHAAAWIVGIVFVAVVALCVWGLYRGWGKTQARIDRLNAQLTESYADPGAVELTALDDDPANPDAELVAHLRETFPQDDGLVQELRISHAASLSRASLNSLSAFLADNTSTSLKDRDAHFAFMDLFRAGEALMEWVEAEMVPADATGESDSDLVIRHGDQREGGWREFGEAQARGEATATAFVTARSAFERVVFEKSIIA